MSPATPHPLSTQHQRSSDVPHRPPRTGPPRRRSRTRSPARPSRRSRRPKKSWALLAVALVAQILVVLDISVVNTALPSIGA